MKKRKLTTLLLMLVIVCLCGSMVILAACNNGDEESSNNRATTTMFSEVMAKLQNTYSVGKTFGVDVAASFVTDDKTEANKDVKYTLTAQGDLDFSKAGENEDSEFLIELNQTKGDVSKVILGIGYEVLSGKPYFYVNLLNGGYAKVDAYSLTALYAMFSGEEVEDNNEPAEEPGVTAAESDNVIVNTIIQALFGNVGTVVDGVYTFNFDLATALANVATALGAIGATLPIDIDAAVAGLFGDLAYTQNGAEVKVTSVATLARYVNATFTFKGAVVIKFVEDKFVSADASFDYQPKTSQSVNASYALSIDKVDIGVVENKYDPIGNTFAINTYAAEGDKTTTNRASIDAKNLLNFSISGKAQLLKDATAEAADETPAETPSTPTVLYKYSVSMNTDINPLNLLALYGANTKDEVLEVLGTLGYINLTVNSLNENDSVNANVITIHCNFADRYAIAFLDGIDFNISGMIDVVTEIGGYYDFDALYDVIGMLRASANASTVAESGISMIGSLLQFISFSEAGLDIRISELLVGLCAMLGIDAETGVMLTPVVGEADVLHIDIDAATFGACERVETSTITAPAGNSNDGTGIIVQKISNLIDAEQSFPQIPTKIEAGDAFVTSSFGSDGTRLLFMDNSFNMHFAYVMGTSEIDESIATEQTVTLYLGFGSDFMTVLELIRSFAIADINPLIPLFGVQKYEIDVTVYPQEPDTTVKSTSEETISAFAEKESVHELVSKAYSGGNYTIEFEISSESYGTRTYDVINPNYKVLDAAGNVDVTSTVIGGTSGANANRFVKTGTYTLRMYYNENYYFDRTIIVTEAPVSEPDNE